MQKLAQGFLCKRSAVVYIEKKDEHGRVIFTATKELYELPNGTWQFGKNKDAKVVDALEEVNDFGEDIQTAVASWLKRIADQPKPKPMIAGQPSEAMPAHSVPGKLAAAITAMTPEMQARLLNSIEQVVGPVVDSASQADEINHHSSGFGQDQEVTAPGRVPFTLPEGCRWAQEGNPAAGYLKPTGNKDNKGNEIMDWHETPAFAALADQQGEHGVTLLKVNPDMQGAMDEIAQARAAAQ